MSGRNAANNTTVSATSVYKVMPTCAAIRGLTEHPLERAVLDGNVPSRTGVAELIELISEVVKSKLVMVPTHTQRGERLVRVTWRDGVPHDLHWKHGQFRSDLDGKPESISIINPGVAFDATPRSKLRNKCKNSSLMSYSEMMAEMSRYPEIVPRKQGFGQ